MNIAMSRIMVVEAGGQFFGIPMDAVTETVRLTPDRISRIKSNDGFVWRDRVVPICSLAELMNLPREAELGSEAKLACRRRDRRQGRRARGRRHPGPARSGAQADARPARRATAMPARPCWATARAAGAGLEGDPAVTVRRDDSGTIVLEGVCPVEDAEPLLQLLQATPRRRSIGRDAPSSTPPSCR